MTNAWLMTSILNAPLGKYRWRVGLLPTSGLGWFWNGSTGITGNQDRYLVIYSVVAKQTPPFYCADKRLAVAMEPLALMTLKY